MTFRILILSLFLFTFSGTILGQNKKMKKKSRVVQPSDTELLEQARALQEKSPKEAIQILEKLIRPSKKKKQISRNTEAEAYILLGDIFEDINQEELAIQRYQQALSILKKSKNQEPVARLYQKMGQLFVNTDNADSAEKSFTLCVKLSNEKSLRQLCEEGIADVELLRGNPEKSLSQLDKVQSEFVTDSITNSRLDAKRSQNYAYQSDYSNAYNSLKNSVDNLPKFDTITEKEYKPIVKAKEKLLRLEELNRREKIEISSTSNASNIPADLAIRENLKLATLYEEEENLDEAERFVEVSKDAIDKNTSAASVADVFKKSAEIKRKRGELDEALIDLEKYISAKEQAIQVLENDLAEQIEIVKGQQKIDLAKKDFDIEEKESELLQSQLRTQKFIIGFLGLLLSASLVFFYFLNKNVKAKRKANQMLLLKSLRTQMNPHFIFNALNSVNNFIAKNDEKAANKFLAEFSRLMRKVLDHSQQDFISFEEEMDLNELYLKLEHFRFRDKFEYSFEKNVAVNSYDLEVPPMLIQPFIENAVWHGLRYKEEHGKLKVQVDEVDNNLIVKIEDNGIGRKKSKALKTANQKKYKSTGLENVSKRIALINEIYEKNYSIEVTDLDSEAEDAGTLVKIKIPI